MSSPAQPMTLDMIERRMEALERLFAEQVRHGRAMEAMAMVMLARMGDPGRVTVREAAALEERLHGKGSVSSVRRKIEEGIYTLEKRPGEKQARIPVEQIYGSGYLPIGTWRELLEMSKRED